MSSCVWNGLSESRSWVVPTRRIVGSAAVVVAAAGRIRVAARPSAISVRVTRPRRVDRIGVLLQGGPPSPGLAVRWHSDRFRANADPYRAPPIAQIIHEVGGAVSSRIGRSIRNDAELGCRRRRAVDAQLGQDPADDRGELEAVRRAQARPRRRAGRAGDRRRSPDPGSACRGTSWCRWAGRARPAGARARKASTRANAASSRSNVRSVGIDRLAAAILGGLRARLAVGREAVERRLVHPDPDREAVRRERASDPGSRSRSPAPW